MKDRIDALRACLAGLPLVGGQPIEVQTGPDGLATAWLHLANPGDLPTAAARLKGAGGRLATTTVCRPDAQSHPDRHEIAYHLLLEGLPVTVKLTLEKDQAAPSITSIFANADWEEREMMELSGIRIAGHPNPRRLFLDESIEAGVFDRYVPFSEMTNLANADAVWARIRAESCDAKRRRAATSAETSAEMN